MKKVLAIASAGGHWVQLRALRQALSESDVIYMTTSNNLALNSSDKNILVSQVDRRNMFMVLVLSVQVLYYFLKVRPDIVISTGASAGFFAIFYGKIFGAKTLWLDSIANYKNLSLSGRMASKFSDVTLTQWESLEGTDKVKYWGSVL